MILPIYPRHQTRKFFLKGQSEPLDLTQPTLHATRHWSESIEHSEHYIHRATTLFNRVTDIG